jgi:steroid delta-isomerase
MPDRSAIEKTIRTYAAAWAARNREGWLDTFADLATQEDPVGERTRRGRGEIGEFWDRAMSGYESLEIRPRHIFVTGREAAMEWPINAATPEGLITFDGVDVFTFDEAARIVSGRAYGKRARIDDQRRPLQRTSGSAAS